MIMNSFKRVEIEDKIWCDKILASAECPSLEYNFTTMFIWGDIYSTKIREHNNNLIVRFGKDSNLFLFPVGKGDIKESIDWILENHENVRFGGLVEENVEFLKANYPDRFEFNEDRNMSDYIYKSESLRELKGKKLSSKRNHINRFVQNNPDWSYEEISEKNIGEVDKMHDEWCKSIIEYNTQGLIEEGKAVKKAIKYYKELGLSGGVIRVNGKIVAFSMGDRLNDDTFLVHIEKAFYDIQGAYPMINKQFVIANCDEFQYVNREEDAGDEGLRKAKLSYRPHIILRKFYAKDIKGE